MRYLFSDIDWKKNCQYFKKLLGAAKFFTETQKREERDLYVRVASFFGFGGMVIGNNIISCVLYCNTRNLGVV